SPSTTHRGPESPAAPTRCAAGSPASAMPCSPAGRLSAYLLVLRQSVDVVLVVLPILLHAPSGAAVLARPVLERRNAPVPLHPVRDWRLGSWVRAAEQVMRHTVRAALGAGAARLRVRNGRLLAEDHDHAQRLRLGCDKPGTDGPGGSEMTLRRLRRRRRIRLPGAGSLRRR